eukprot:12565324-Alexandrium_andersonii.AAC.1
MGPAFQQHEAIGQSTQKCAITYPRPGVAGKGGAPGLHPWVREVPCFALRQIQNHGSIDSSSDSGLGKGAECIIACFAP